MEKCHLGSGDVGEAVDGGGLQELPQDSTHPYSLDKIHLDQLYRSECPRVRILGKYFTIVEPTELDYCMQDLEDFKVTLSFKRLVRKTRFLFDRNRYNNVNCDARRNQLY